MAYENQATEKKLNSYNGIAYASGETVTADKNINNENVLQYEFYNFSNVPCLINGMFLDRYYTGGLAAPTVISGAINSWKPSMGEGEVDTSIYVVQFLDKFYPSVTVPYHKLIVMRKGLAILPGNR